MKILCISDTHGFHNQLYIPKDIDMIIHAGDCSNWRDRFKNEEEVRDFITWYSRISVKYKIYVAGNHDTSIEAGHITKDNFEQSGIIYLEHETINIEGVNIFGSPYTPEFGNWAFNVRKDRLYDYWQEIPSNTDILITHGPAKWILDICGRDKHEIEYAGCRALYNKITDINSIKYHIFGHIHNNDEHINSGSKTINNCITKFMNVSCVTNAKFDKGLTSQGQIIKYETKESKIN